MKSPLRYLVVTSCVFCAALVEVQAGSDGLADTSAGGAWGTSPSDITQLMEGHSLLVVLLSLFALGLALVLTPCVYPMVPITVAFFSRQGEGKTARVLLLAALYALGIAITYSTLGAVAALTGRMFGQHLQSPWVFAGIAAVLVALALSLLGVYHFRLPGFLMQRISGVRNIGMLGSLAMGMVVGVVAAPCVGPVTVGLLVYVSTTGDPWLGFWLFFVLALGLGTPYVALAVFSGALGRLPKAGVWMIWVERLFGFLMLGLALYFLSPLLPRRALPWAVFALAAVAGVYLGWLEPSQTGGRVFNWLKKAVGVACLIIGVVSVVPRPSPADEIAWQPYSTAILKQADQEGRPVILDFYADWCLDCHEMERTTYRDTRVIEASKSFVMVKVDVTESDSPEARRLLEEFAVWGVPTLIFLNAQGEEIAESRAVGYVGSEDLLRKMEQVLREQSDPMLTRFGMRDLGPFAARRYVPNAR
jgi:thiol:disulfide interchange protein DsbD